MRKFLNSIIGFWKTLNKRQKLILISAVGCVIIGLILFLLHTTKVEYVPLYTELTPEEITKIVAKLEEYGQPYMVKGTTIKVPTFNRDKLRLQLAQEEVAPTGGLVGFEIFDKTRLTLTDFERRINYRRALEGELTRTINSLPAVQKSRVFISMPKKELYVEKELPITASIKLQLKPHKKLKPEQVKGIINLVAYAVEGLSPENVMVVDEKGNILSEDLNNPDSQAATLAAKQLELQNLQAKELEKKIKQKLGKVLGLDKVEVFVKWEMNFDRVEKTQDKYSMPGFEQLKAAEEVQTEELKGEAMVPGGVPGMEAQMPTYKGVKGITGPISYKKEEKKINYLADHTREIHIKSPSISKISVAVFIDGTYERDAFGRLKYDKEGKPIYKPRTSQEMRKYEDIVWAAIGAEKGKEYLDREYIVSVENVQFDRTAEWALELREERMLKRQKITILSLVGIVGLLMILGLFLLFIKLIKRPRIEVALPAPTLPPGVPPLPPEEAPERTRMIEEAKRLTREKPMVVADLIRTWLAEE